MVKKPFDEVWNHQLEGRMLPDNAEKTAATYASNVESSNELAMTVSMGLNNAYLAGLAALNGFFSAAGYSQTVPRYTVLRLLYFAKDHRLSLNEVRSEMAVTSGNITFLVDSLEEAKLARRVPHATDRRVKDVELTAAGLELAAALVPTMVQFMESICQDFSKSELSLFRDFLQRYHITATRIVAESNA